MLTALIAPTSRNLMAPETARIRLGLPEEALPALEMEVEEASAMVARYLRFEPAFGTWQETFAGPGTGLDLWLGARPAWAILAVSGRVGGLLDAGRYRLERGPRGESKIWQPGSWVGPPCGPAEESTLPDWTVQYEAGWWLEEMGEDRPAGVDPLPPDVRRDFLKVLTWCRWEATRLPGVRRMKDEGAEVEFFGAETDSETGIPCACTTSLALYRRVGA